MLWLVYFLCMCVCVFVLLVAYFYYTTPSIGVLYIYNNNNNIWTVDPYTTVYILKQLSIVTPLDILHTQLDTVLPGY